MDLTNKLTYIDLFAGCGGLSPGLERAGFFPLYVNELNKDAIETYLINHNIYSIYEKDPQYLVSVTPLPYS